MVKLLEGVSIDYLPKYPNVLSLALDGPLTPHTMYNVFKQVVSNVYAMDYRNLPWGIVLRVNKDAAFFNEAMEVFALIIDCPEFKHLRCVSLVIQWELPRSLEMMTRIHDSYYRRTPFVLNAFGSHYSALDWTRDYLLDIS